jgi:hypothetical protein
MNDAFEGLYEYEVNGSSDALKQRLAEDKEKLRICSLSTREDNRLMWGYYGGFSGVVIEVSNLEANRKDIKSVHYTDEVLIIDNVCKRTPQARDLLLRKHSDWQHEQEVRALIKEDDLIEGKYLPVRIKRIILGQNIKEWYESRIKVAVRKRNRSSLQDQQILLEKQAKLSLKSYKILQSPILEK